MQPQPIAIKPLTPHHAAAAALLHVASQPATFLTRLGPELLTVVYRQLPQSVVGFGFAACAALPQPELVGFVSATTGIGRLFLEMGTRLLPQLLPPLLAGLARQPSLIWLSMQTLLYPWLVQTAATAPQGPTAELLSIMVEPRRRSQGVGGALLDALVVACPGRGIRSLEVTVDQENQGARRFYARRGFLEHGTILLYGRPMCLYQLTLPVPPPPSPEVGA